ncbi:oligosaccharide flippase family protein [Antarcticirhabdus aurantiaca]|uniref:Oligosaccharide flippase family protein n=1 Tax=Antarcticirhabdus aurantiaca TaxID=2606717 RepID=A0ACD4NQL8_9HYPH|nr:oligosaccharide flippase family protein [Antarcticirhabdus aurantiaca]WAJ29166.1 oligosaccharide flippase family protein [Jeongeuplla avenae]
MNQPSGRLRKLSSVASVAVGPVARASNQLVTFALTLVAIRYLSPAEFGAFALASIAVTVIRTLLYSGAFEYLLKAPSARQASTETLVFNVLLVTVLNLLVLGGLWLADSLGYAGDITSLLLILVPSNFIAALGAWQESLLLRSNRLTPYYMLTFAAELLSMLVAVAMFATGFGLLALVGQIYARNILIAAFYLALQRPVFSERFSTTALRAMTLWSLPRYGSISLNMTSTYAVDLLLGIFMSPAATGIYRASSRLVTAVADIFNQPTRIISMTMISRNVAAGRPVTSTWTLIFAVAAVVGLSALAGLGSVSGLLVPVLMGPEWSAAAPVVAVLCVARAFMLFDSAMMPALVAHNHQKSVFYMQVVTTALLLAFMIAAAPHGVLAASVAAALAAACNSLLIYSLAHRRLSGSGTALAKILPAALLPPLATFAAAAGLILMLGTAGMDPIALLVAAIATGMGGWLIAVLALLPRLKRIASMLRQQSKMA